MPSTRACYCCSAARSVAAVLDARQCGMPSRNLVGPPRQKHAEAGLESTPARPILFPRRGPIDGHGLRRRQSRSAGSRSSVPQHDRGRQERVDLALASQQIDHPFRVDRRNPIVGFINRDEASILYANARAFAGRAGSRSAPGEAGRPPISSPRASRRSMSSSRCSRTRIGGPSSRRSSAAPAGPRRPSSCAEKSPEAVVRLGEAGARWSFAFIDGDHDGEAPRRDALACAPYLEPTAMVLFHDLVSPHVAAGLRALEAEGWNVMAYQTAQMMGVAWRGEIAPVAHKPDPTQRWQVPDHLSGIPISGEAAA